MTGKGSLPRSCIIAADPIEGWVSTLSWQAGAASGSFLTGTIIQGLMTVNNPDYSPTNWQGTLFVFAMVLVLFVFNIWGAKALPLVQNALLGVHIIGWLVIIVTLWALAPKESTSVVFTQFSNRGGWSSIGLSLMVGQISAIFGSTCKLPYLHKSMTRWFKGTRPNDPRFIGPGDDGYVALYSSLVEKH